MQNKIPHCLTNAYQSYRQWCKNRGRKKKAKKRLEKMVTFYSQFIKEGDLCFDIGANIGNRTDAFLKLGANVVAVEPQKQCLEVLNKKYGDNEKVNLVAKALDENFSEKEMLVSDSSTLSSMCPDWIDSVKKSGRFATIKWNEKQTVQTITLDTLIEEFGVPDFCKIDVEGFEENVLRGLSQPLKVVSFEFTPEFIDPTIMCINYLANLGNVEFNYSVGESMEIVLHKWVSPEQMIEKTKEISKHGAGAGTGDIYARFK